jgi:peptide-methionine (S)-S-oxide reductase
MSFTKSMPLFAATAMTLVGGNFPAPAVDIPAGPGKQAAPVVFAGGCFWGMEAIFEHLDGVLAVTSGFAGGSAETAQYETVSEGGTGHAESVQIFYDPSRISYGKLLQVFFSVAHDPTQLNRQGPDNGTQYRSAIFYSTDEQKKVAQAYIQQLTKAKVFRFPVVTEVTPLIGFYPAEDYHQRFVDRNPDYPYVVYNDLPKLKRLESEFPELLRR